MSNTADDDEWDKVEISLEALKMEEPKVQILSKPAIVTAPRVSLPSSASNAPQTAPKILSSDTADSYVELVDAALVGAVSNPRERMFLFQLEDSILNFVKTSLERSMELPPMNTTYRRLLAYRVGQRFNLTHLQSEFANEYGERGITLMRTSGTSVPRYLLIDLNIPVRTEGDESPSAYENSSGGGGGGGDFSSVASNMIAVPIPSKSKAGVIGVARVGGGHSAGVSTSTGAPKKFQLMRRDPAKTDNDTRQVAVKTQQSVEDKEKAYLEARARIFGEEIPASGNGTPTTEVVAEKSATASPALETGRDGKKNNGATAASVSPVANSRGNNSPSLSVGSTASASGRQQAQQQQQEPGKRAGKTSPALPQQQQQQQQQQGNKGRLGTASGNNSGTDLASAGGAGGATANNKKAVVDASSWKEKKSQFRDVHAERADPDFARRGAAGGGRAIAEKGSFNNYNNGPVGVGMGMGQQPPPFGVEFYPPLPSGAPGGAVGGGANMLPQQIAHMQAQIRMHEQQMQFMQSQQQQQGSQGMYGSAQQQFYQQQEQEHLQFLRQQQQQQQFGDFPPLGPGGLRLAPTLQTPAPPAPFNLANPYYPGDGQQQQQVPFYPGGGVGGIGGNPYYPEPSQQGQNAQGQQFMPPPPVIMQSPNELFYDYSHLATKNQTQTQAQGQTQGGSQSRAGGNGGGISPNSSRNFNNNSNSNNNASKKGLFNRNNTDFPPLA